MLREKRRKHTGLHTADIVPPEEVLFGCSEAMEEVRRRASKVAGTGVPVLLYGPEGSGKEVLAKWIHNHSAVCEGQFVKVNCAAIPGNLLESELFGYEKGAFTGAHSTKPGRVELAHNGTLFLDGIADFESGLQSKLLHFLQDGRFSRIGEGVERVVETRLICATSRNLSAEVESGRFRRDLYYRINVICLELPGLRERREDIPLLVDHFRRQLNSRFERNAPPLPEEVVDGLRHQEWRGNIRELENFVARYTILGLAEAVGQETTRECPATRTTKQGEDGSIPLKQIAKQATLQTEANLILKALRENKWNRRKAAESLKISYRTLIYKMRGAGYSSKHNGNGSVPKPPQIPKTGIEQM